MHRNVKWGLPWSRWAAVVFGVAMGFVLGDAAAYAQAAAPVVSTAPAKTLSLQQAIALALRVDPQLSTAVNQRERGELGVLRAQLDRFSLRVDSFVTEQYRVSNLGGAASPAGCGVLAPTGAVLGGGSGLVTPLQVYSVGAGSLGVPSEAECGAVMGQYVPPSTIQSGAQGQFNLSADLGAGVLWVSGQ